MHLQRRDTAAAAANSMHPMPAFSDRTRHRRKWWASTKTSASNSKVKPASFPTQSGSTSATFAVRQLDPWYAHFEITFVLKEVEVPQPLDLSVVNLVFTL